jgi:type IV pilus assembly protein PilC
LGSVSVALVAAGAAGGVLAATFTKLAEALEAQVAIRRKIRGALTYPAVVLALSVAMAASMLLFVVPTFKGLYTELHGQLPWPTRVLVAASNIARSDFWLLPAVGAAAAAAGRRWYRQHRLVADAAKVRVPVIGAMLNKGAVTRVASTLASLLEAGVTTLVGLDMAAAAAGLEPLSMSLATVAEHVRNGRPLTAALAEDGLWPDVMVQLVRVGEETGQVPALLARYAEISRQELSAEVERVVSLIEPLMVVVIGGVVGVTVVCLYLPLFDLVNLIH